MRKKGAAELVVLLFLLPVLSMLAALCTLLLTDEKIVSCLVQKTQAQYNCELGILDGQRRLAQLSYNKSNEATYYISLSEPFAITATAPPSSLQQDYVRVLVIYRPSTLDKPYAIKVLGIHQEAYQERTIYCKGDA